MKVAIAIFVFIVTPMLSSAFNSNDHIDISGSSWYTKFEPSSPFKRDSQYKNGATPEEQKSVDLHKGEFCVDVSTYSPVQYDNKAVNVCDSTFVKNCRDRSEQVVS